MLHGIGDDDEMGGSFGGVTLRQAEGCIGQGSLEGSKGGSVNGMDDDGHAGTSSGQAPQKTGLAAMRMDNVRTA